MFVKRLLITGLVILLIFITAIYFFIPSTLTVQNVTAIKCNPIGSSRIITDWRKAFYIHTDTSFSLNGYSYSVVKKFSNGADFLIINDNHFYATKALLLPHSPDSSSLIWTTICKTGNNPIARVKAYFRLIGLKKNLNICTQQLASYLSTDSNIYRYKISYTTLTDTFLVSIKHTFSAFPSIDDVYKMIDQLKKYAKEQGAKQTNYPMLNSVKTDSGFIVMAGLPVNKSLPMYGDIQPKRLSPMKDKILATEITGGEATVQDAFMQIELYMQDHSLSAPVIPFEFLITDRNKESDTSKWHTTIYYPII